MATRFYDYTTDVAAKPYRTHQGPGVVFVGALTTTNPTSLPGSMIPVGLTDGAIELNPNVEVSPITSAQSYNPYNMVETAWAWQVTMSLDHIDPYTMALAWSYDISDTITGGSVLSLTGQCPSPFRAVRIDMQGPTDSGNTVTQTMSIEGYKGKWTSNGGMTIDPATKSTLPIMIHLLGNDSDVVGKCYYSAHLKLRELLETPTIQLGTISSQAV